MAGFCKHGKKYTGPKIVEKFFLPKEVLSFQETLCPIKQDRIWRHDVHSKCYYPYTNLQGVTFPNTVIFILANKQFGLSGKTPDLYSGGGGGFRFEC
jgi:hypothetical protein